MARQQGEGGQDGCRAKEEGVRVTRRATGNITRCIERRAHGLPLPRRKNHRQALIGFRILFSFCVVYDFEGRTLNSVRRDHIGLGRC